jgi:hypothetical protein
MQYRVNEEFMSKATLDFLVLLSPQNELAYFSNDVGSLIWQLLKAGKSEEEILRRILEEYEVEEVQAKKDLQLFLEELLQADIIRKLD